MSFLLKVIAGPDAGKTFPVPITGSMTLGRGDVDAALTDPSVSRKHLQIVVQEGQVSLIDLGSKVGSLVNNARVAGPTPLRHGDVIVAASTHLQLLSSAEADETRSGVPAFRPGASPAVPILPAARPAPPKPPVPVKANESLKALAGLVNTAFGHFTIGPVLGTGQAGMVFRALDNRDSREVALKVFIPEFSRNEADVQRFTRAAKTIAPLRHMNIVSLLGAGRESGKCWLAMELVEGPSVAWLVQQAATGRPDWHAALRVLLHGTRALIYLHDKQVLHRNLTPNNVLMSKADGVVKVGDLMTAKAQEGKLAQDLTSEGMIIGDPCYMAPERTGGASEGDERSDLYGLGALVYAALTGRPPFKGASVMETITKARSESPVPPRKIEPQVPQVVEDLVLRLLAKNPEHRFVDATELLRHLVDRRLIET